MTGDIALGQSVRNRTENEPCPGEPTVVFSTRELREWNA